MYLWRYCIYPFVKVYLCDTGDVGVLAAKVLDGLAAPWGTEDNSFSFPEKIEHIIIIIIL